MESSVLWLVFPHQERDSVGGRVRRESTGLVILRCGGKSDFTLGRGKLIDFHWDRGNPGEISDFTLSTSSVAVMGA